MGWDQGLDQNGVAYKIASATGVRIRVIAGPGTGKSYAMKRRCWRRRSSLRRFSPSPSPAWPPKICIASFRSSMFPAARSSKARRCTAWRCVSSPLSEEAHVCIVGDDDQSIYSFKHAHPDGIREWKTIHAGCADFEMAQCQRCPTTVVEMANSLISHNVYREKRELKPIDAKGKGEAQIVQLATSEVEAKWIAKKVLADLEPLKEDLPKLVDDLFPAGQAEIAELRELALSVVEEAEDADDLFSAMMKEITQPDIPPEVKEVRVMSLHKSKGLSAPYVFIAQCVQGVLPQLPKPGTPKATADAALEEARRLFFVGITRVKAEDVHPGSLFITYPREMGANAAKQLDIPFTRVNYGQAQLSPSIFIQELGKAAPAPVAGKV